MAVLKSFRAILEGDPVNPVHQVVPSELRAKLEQVESSITSGLILKATLIELKDVLPAVDGTGGEVPSSDTGFHSSATATGYDGPTVANAGRYSFNLAWGRWERIGPPGTSGLAPLVHNHEIADVNGLSAALDTKADSSALGSAAAAATGDFATAAQGALAASAVQPAALAAGLDNTFSKSENLSDLISPARARFNLGTTSNVAPAAARLTASRIAMKNESARLDFAAGAGFIRGAEGDIAGTMDEIATLAETPADLLYRREDGTYGAAPAEVLRRVFSPDGFLGGQFEPAGTVHNPTGLIGATGYNLIGLDAATSAVTPLVDGETPRIFAAQASGDATRRIEITGIDIVPAWYQLSVIVETLGAPFLLVRFPGVFGNPTLGGSAFIAQVDTASRTITHPSTTIEVEGAVIEEIRPGAFHIRYRAKAFASATNQYMAIVAKDAAGPTLNSTFTAGQNLFRLHHMSVQQCAGARQPAPKLGSGVAVPADLFEYDVSGLPGNNREFTFEVHFRISQGTPEQSGVVTPVFKLGAAGDIAARGIGIELDGREIRAVLRPTTTPVTLGLADLYASDYRVAMSFDGATLRLAVNGRVASMAATLNETELAAQFERLFIGDYNAILDGNLRPFSGQVALWRYSITAMNDGELAALTIREAEAGPGEKSPIVVGEDGVAKISANSRGEIAFLPDEATEFHIASGARFSEGLPDDAIGITPKSDGQIYFSSETWGGVLRSYRKRKDILLGTVPGGVIDCFLGGGQSLMYAYVYPGGFLDVPHHPLFLDVADGVPNSMFVTSTEGYPASEPAIPYIDNPGGGGVMYPAGHALARLRAQDPAPTAMFLAKSMGNSGESIINLSPTNQNTAWDQVYWDNINQLMQSWVDTAAALGCTTRVPAMYFVHGTANGTSLDYNANLAVVRQDFDDLFDSYHAAQDAAPIWLLTQNGSRTNMANRYQAVMIQQLEYCEITPNTVLACPLYMPEILLADGEVHPTYDSTSYFSELMAIAHFEYLAGRKWTLGTPDISVAGPVIELDFSKWLRPDETLRILPDTYYGGIGIDGGQGIEIVEISDVNSQSYTRTGASIGTITNVEVINDGTAYRVTNSVAPSGNWQLRYAMQQQDVSVSDPLRYAARGLLATTWERASALQPSRTLKRFLNAFQWENLV